MYAATLKVEIMPGSMQNVQYKQNIEMGTLAGISWLFTSNANKLLQTILTLKHTFNLVVYMYSGLWLSMDIAPLRCLPIGRVYTVHSQHSVWKEKIHIHNNTILGELIYPVVHSLTS